MPRVDELLNRLERAQRILADAPHSQFQEKTVFSTPSGHLHYMILPFGLHEAPTTFQRMMDIFLWPHQVFPAAYLDDVVIHSGAERTISSGSWESAVWAMVGWINSQPQEVPPESGRS